MASLIVVFVLSLIFQIGFLAFLDPGDISNLNHFAIISFNLNLAVLIGSLLSLLLFFFYFFMNYTAELTSKSYYRRGFGVGALIAIISLINIYGELNLLLLILIILGYVILEIIMSVKN